MGLYGKYTGKEPCQGCGLSVVNKPREVKNELCEECKKVLKIGRRVEVENLIEYVTVKDWHSGHSSIDFNDTSLDVLANALLESLHNPNASSKTQIAFMRSQYLGASWYNIPVKVSESLKNFLGALDNKIQEIRRLKNDAELNARNAVANEKNTIYNAGVEEGKNLLIQLNNGSLSIDDFNKKLKKY